MSGPPAWRLGDVLTTPHLKNISPYEQFTKKASDLDYTLVRRKQLKRYMRFGTWNVRSLYRAVHLQRQPGN
jgi:hypothetical protein